MTRQSDIDQRLATLEQLAMLWVAERYGVTVAGDFRQQREQAIEAASRYFAQAPPPPLETRENIHDQGREANVHHQRGWPTPFSA